MGRQGPTPGAGLSPCWVFRLLWHVWPSWRAVGVSLLHVSYARGSQLPVKVEQQHKHTSRDRNTHTDAVPSFHAQATTHSEYSQAYTSRLPIRNVGIGPRLFGQALSACLSKPRRRLPSEGPASPASNLCCVRIRRPQSVALWYRVLGMLLLWCCCCCCWW